MKDTRRKKPSNFPSLYLDKKTKQPPKNKFAGPQKKNTPKSSDIKNMFKALPTKRKVEVSSLAGVIKCHYSK